MGKICIFDLFDQILLVKERRKMRYNITFPLFHDNNSLNVTFSWLVLCQKFLIALVEEEKKWCHIITVHSKILFS